MHTLIDSFRMQAPGDSDVVWMPNSITVTERSTGTVTTHIPEGSLMLDSDGITEEIPAQVGGQPFKPCCC